MADVRGEVHDTLVTTSSLVVRASGKISGAVYYREVEIEKGGDLFIAKFTRTGHHSTETHWTRGLLHNHSGKENVFDSPKMLTFH